MCYTIGMAFAEIVTVSGSTLVASSTKTHIVAPREGYLRVVSGTDITLGGEGTEVFPWSDDDGPFPLYLIAGDKFYASGTGSVAVVFFRGE